MAFVDTYKYGSLYVDFQGTINYLEDHGVLETGDRKAVQEALAESTVEFSFDEDWESGSMYRNDAQETPLVLIGMFGGYPGEAIDDANSQAAKEWAADRDYIYSFSSWFGGCEMVSLYLDWDSCTLEEAEEAIELAEGFMDYPVLDEDLWSEIESKRWDEMIEEMINDTQGEKDIEFTEEQVAAIRELASEVYGYWEEGYFPDDEWGQIIEEVLAVEEGTVVQLHQSEKLF